MRLCFLLLYRSMFAHIPPIEAGKGLILTHRNQEKDVGQRQNLQ